MRHVSPFFPGGGTGAGLLLIRASVGASLLIAASADSPPSFGLPLAGLLSVLVAIGYRTRIVALLGICLISYLWVLGRGAMLIDAPQVVTALALGCTGPGAFSLDAYAFGRSTIVMNGRRKVDATARTIPATNHPPDRGGQL